MRKQLLISLLFYTTLTTSTINAASSANEFFKNVTRANISQLFNASPTDVKNEIHRRVTDRMATKESLGVNVMLFAPLKENADISKYSPSTSANTTNAVGTLSDEQRAIIYGNTTGAETGAHRVKRDIGTIDSSAFTQAENAKKLEEQRKTENAARLEAARKAEEQKQRIFQEQFEALKTKETEQNSAIATSEANERDNLKKAFSQSAFELHERIANSNEEQSARSALVDAHTQSLADAKNAEAKRKQTEFDAQLADLQKTETAKRIEMENSEQNVNLQDAHTQSLAEAKNAEAKRKQTEDLNAQLANLKNAESTDREAIADDASLENSERNERNELSRTFQIEKIRLEKKQQKKAEQLQEDNRRRALTAIEDAERDAEKSMGAILQNELNELTNLHKQIALQLENLTLEAAKRKRLEEKKQEIETLTEKVTITQRDLTDTDYSIFLVANEAINIMLNTYSANREKIEEINRFRNAIQTNDINKIERILRTLQDFSDRGMIQAAEGSRTTASNMFSGFITWYSQKVQMTDELRRNINQLKRELN